jgi:hypothetical protein
MIFSVIAGPPPTGPREARPDDKLRGETRQSSIFAKKMDARVKPAHDS